MSTAENQNSIYENGMYVAFRRIVDEVAINASDSEKTIITFQMMTVFKNTPETDH